MTEQTLIVPETGEVIQWRDSTEEIVQLPIRVSWDIREKSPLFTCDEGEEPSLSGQLISASHLYACWSDQVGQPLCMGAGKVCPDHPEASQEGIGLVLSTDQFGLVFMQCFGMMRNWAQGLCRLAWKQEGDFSTDGFKSINTKHGSMQIPRLVK